MQKQFVFFSGLFITMSIVLGAMGTHALKEILKPQQLESFEVAVRYQGFLSMGILILALNADRFSFSLKNILSAMTIGMVLFCFSIYALVLCITMTWPTTIIGPLTPIGGSITIISWTVFLYRLIRN